MTEKANDKQRKSKWLKIFFRLHFLLLCVLIVILWGALTLPIVFFNDPPDRTPSEFNSPNSNLSATCSDSKTLHNYTEPICRTALTKMLQNHNCSISSVDVVVTLRQATAMDLGELNQFDLLNPSKECKDKMIPFLCLYLLGVCSDTGVQIYPTSEECRNIQENICTREWKTAIAFGSTNLPNCDTLRISSPSCDPDKESNRSMATDNVTVINSTHEETLTNLNCSEGFYKDSNASRCFPSCYYWNQFSKEVTIASKVVIILSAIVAFTVSVMGIILSCLFHKRMFQFPSILIIYMLIDTLVLGATLIVSFIDDNKLYCSSENLQESFLSVAPFCDLSGIIIEYILFQLTLLWLFHVITLFLRIVFPLQAMAMGKTKTNYLHGLFVFTGLLLPLLPVITTIIHFAITNDATFGSGGIGFGFTQFPPLLCYSKSPDVLFYSFTLFIAIMLGLGSTLLLIIAWSLNRKYLKNKMTDSTIPLKIGKPEVKLLMVCFYYIISSVLSMSALTINTANFSPLTNALTTYFFCEQNGYNPDNECKRDDINRYSHPFLTTMSFVFLCFLPVFNSVYIVNRQEMKEKLYEWKLKKCYFCL